MSPLTLYESIFTSSPIAGYLVAPTPDATILAVNNAFLEVASRKREDLIGQSIYVAFPDEQDDADDSGAVALRNSIKRVIATGRPDSLPKQRYPIRITLPDGSKRYEERIWNAVNTPVFGPDGDIVCVSHTTVDITESVYAQAALQKSEARYRSLFNSIEEGFCIIQMLFDERGQPFDYRFCDVNPVFAGQTGLHNAEGKTMRELAPSHEAIWFETYGKVATTGEPARFESEAKALDRWFEVYAFRTDEPDAYKVAVLFRDITQQKQQEEILRRSERYAFAAAHEAATERRRLDAVLEAAPVGIYVADATGARVRENAAHRSLWSVDGRQQPQRADDYKRWKGWWVDGSKRHGEPLAASEWPLAQALRGEDSHDNIIEVESFSAPFVRKTVLASGSPIKDDAGKTVGAVVARMDITDRIKAEIALRETASRLEFILESAQIGEWDLDLATDTSSRSLRHDQCFGYAEPIPEWGIEKALAHIHPDDRFYFKQSFDTAIARLQDWHFEGRTIWPDGSVHWIAAHGSVYGTAGKPTRMAGIIFDITERRQAEEKVRHASLHDPLTGLPNRTMLYEYAGHLLPHNRRTNRCAAVLFLDLDRFKPINDTHGHEAGDKVLKEVAYRLSRTLRADDIVIRLGGDEFVVLLQDIREAAYAAEATRHIVDKINEPYHVGELALSLSTSVGISIFPSDGQDIGTLVSHADTAMYQAKQAGRNNFQFYSPEFAEGTSMQFAIEQQLKSALVTSAFHLCYQPVVDLETGEVVSVEALLRWPNDDIGPERFVPVAETTGIINPIGRWVLREASRQHKEWIAHGLPPIPIAINVSVVEFRDRDFIGRFERLIGEIGIEAHVLQIELTEAAVMDDIDHAFAVLTALRTLGVTILLDDFGTGRSNLAHLAGLPLNKIKIDKSFIGRLDSDASSRAVTDAMLALGHTLHLDVVAEGVERESALEYVRSHGCQQAQGYFFSLPMSGDTFESWYWKHRQQSERFDTRIRHRPRMPS